MLISKKNYSRIMVLSGMFVFWGLTAFAGVSEQTRTIANQMASRSVSRLGCSDFEQYFQAELAPRLDSLRKSRDWDTKYLQNLIWHYSKKRYKRYDQKYEKSSAALMTLVSEYLKSGKASSEAVARVSSIAKRYGISCECKDALTAEATSQAAQALSQIDSLNQGTNLQVDAQATECKTDSDSSSLESAIDSAAEADVSKTESLLDIAYEGTKIRRNRYRQVVGSKDSSESTKLCASYVSIALEQAGCRAKGGPEFRGHAKSLGNVLSKNGFKNLMSEKGELPEGIKSLDEVPDGAVLVYDGGFYGHAEIRGKDGYMSDYYTQNARTGPSAGPEGRGRRIIGIWVKPSCGAGYEK